MRLLAALPLLAATALLTAAACGQYGPPRRGDSPAVAAAEVECTDDEEEKP